MLSALEQRLAAHNGQEQCLRYGVRSKIGKKIVNNMKFGRRIVDKLWRYARTEIKSLICFENNRCQSTSTKGKKCIKQNDHLLWHEDAWRDWWW